MSWGTKWQGVEVARVQSAKLRIALLVQVQQGLPSELQVVHRCRPRGSPVGFPGILLVVQVDRIHWIPRINIDRLEE